MDNLSIALNKVAPDGQSFVVTDQQVWENPILDCGLDYQISKALEGRVVLIPRETGCIVTGQLSGQVQTACDRCGEPSVINIKHSFESFEPYPESALEFLDEGTDSGLESAGEVDELIISMVNNVPHFNLAGLFWEEFVLALPHKPLCSNNCLGLCAQCGKNLNEGACACPNLQGDLRLAALRGLKIAPKSPK